MMSKLFEKKYQCSTLQYSAFSLAVVMGLILLGFFSYSLAVGIVTSVIPLRLKELGASGKTMAFILSTIGTVFNMTICPIVSFRSDRYRSKWGRRIPFILGTLPMFCGALLLFGFSDWIGNLLHPLVSRWAEVSPATLIITVIGIVMAIYQFFFMFVGSVIFYIYNDVIPSQFLARIVGMVQVVTTLATALFNFFIFKYSLTHFRWVMILAAVIYAAGMLVMCLMLKEPEYPPLDPNEKRQSQGLRGVMTFMRESFSHPFYLNNFVGGALISVGGLVGTYMVFLHQNMGLSLAQLGEANGYSGLIQTAMSMTAAIFLTIFIDRWHPTRISFFVAIFLMLPVLANWKWIFVTPPPQVYWWTVLGTSIAWSIIGIFQGLSSLPYLMRVFPKSRFGQFCSAQSLLRSVIVLIFGYVVGIFIDVLQYNCHLGDRAFRYLVVWQAGWMILGLIFYCRMFRWWHKLGGDENYKAPAPWSPEKFEAMPVTPVVRPVPLWINIALAILSVFFLFMFLGAAGIGIAAQKFGFAYEAQQMFRWALPCSAAALVVWLIVMTGILRDVKRAKAGQTPRSGIPHHGILMILAIRQMAMLVLNFYQSIASLSSNDGVAAKLWLLESIIAIIIALVVWLVAWLERGYATRLQGSDLAEEKK